MTYKNKLLATILASTLACSATAFAGGASSADVPTYHNYNDIRGWYASINGGSAVIGEVNKSTRRFAGIMGGGGAGYLGVQLDSFWAAEVGVGYFDMFFGHEQLFSASVRISQALGQRGLVFAKLGVGAVTLRACSGGCKTETKGGPAFAAGLGLMLSRQVMATVQYNAIYISSGMSNGSLGGLTAGLAYYFKA